MVYLICLGRYSDAVTVNTFITTTSRRLPAWPTVNYVHLEIEASPKLHF